MKGKIFRNKKLGIVLKVLTTGIIILALFFLVKELISNIDSITKISKSAGVFGPVVLIILISFGILLTPIPSVVLIITAGYLYGTWMGALYSYLAHMIAAIGTFAIVKAFEINKGNKRYEKYKSLVEKNKKILYILYMVPIVPISIISTIAATSKIRWKQFIKINLISFAPTVLFFSFFGDRISNKNLLEIGVLIILTTIGALIIYRIMKKKQPKMNSPAQ